MCLLSVCHLSLLFSYWVCCFCMNFKWVRALLTPCQVALSLLTGDRWKLRHKQWEAHFQIVRFRFSKNRLNRYFLRIIFTPGRKTLFKVNATVFWPTCFVEFELKVIGRPHIHIYGGGIFVLINVKWERGSWGTQINIIWKQMSPKILAETMNTARKKEQKSLDKNWCPLQLVQ